jgi:putative holliday junction resolvase
MPKNSSSTILALDVGGRRIGVAAANIVARIAHPLVTLENNPDMPAVLQQLIAEQQAIGLVVGLPRNLNGEETGQTQTVRQFVADLQTRIKTPVYWQDEAVTSRKAETELAERGKPFAKGDIDALAATYILEDFLREHPEVRI